MKAFFSGHWKEVTIGAWLTGLIGFFGGMEAVFGADELFKYINPYLVIWCRIIGAIGLATTLPLKGYFSTSYKGSKQDLQTTQQQPQLPSQKY